MPTILISRVNTAANRDDVYRRRGGLSWSPRLGKFRSPLRRDGPPFRLCVRPGNDALLALVRFNLPHDPKSYPPRHFPGTPAEPLESCGSGGDRVGHVPNRTAGQVGCW